MKLIKDSGLKPKRTLRFIAWSGEEWGSQKNGAHAYLYTHRNELKNHIVAFEDDLGSTKLLGFGFSQVPGREADIKIVENLSKTYL